MQTILKILVLLGICLSSGCGVQVDDSDSLDIAPTPTAPLATLAPDPTPQATSPLMTSPVPSNLQNLVEKAKEDLSQRLSIVIDQINIVEIVDVEWSDSSLGCPQPDMSYLQVIIPGYRILLDVNGQQYEYHSNGDSYFVYCEDPDLPNLPKP